MCEPVSLTAGTLGTLALASSAASAAAGIGSAVIGTINQNKQSQANARSAMDAYHLKTAQQALRARQEAEKATQQKEDARLKTLRSKGTANTAADAGNVKGISVNRLLDDYSRSEAIFNDRVNQNLEASRTQTGFESRAFAAEADRRIASVPPAGMEKIFGATISGATKLTGAFGDFGEALEGDE